MRTVAAVEADALAPQVELDQPEQRRVERGRVPRGGLLRQLLGPERLEAHDPHELRWTCARVEMLPDLDQLPDTPMELRHDHGQRRAAIRPGVSRASRPRRRVGRRRRRGTPRPSLGWPPAPAPRHPRGSPRRPVDRAPASRARRWRAPTGAADRRPPRGHGRRRAARAAARRPARGGCPAPRRALPSQASMRARSSAGNCRTRPPAAWTASRSTPCAGGVLGILGDEVRDAQRVAGCHEVEQREGPLAARGLPQQAARLAQHDERAVTEQGRGPQARGDLVEQSCPALGDGAGTRSRRRRRRVTPARWRVPACPGSASSVAHATAAWSMAHASSPHRYASCVTMPLAPVRDLPP